MKPLEKARLARQAMKERGEQITQKTWTQKSKENPKSWKFRVYAKCADDCALGQREEVRKCTCKDTCPLWDVRPYR